MKRKKEHNKKKSSRFWENRTRRQLDCFQEGVNQNPKGELSSEKGKKDKKTKKTTQPGPVELAER